jgi:cytochrome b involved in lipid metabolism
MTFLVLLSWCTTTKQDIIITDETLKTWEIVTEVTWNNIEITGEIIVTWYSLDEVKLHGVKENCRTAVDWKVYDITKAFWNHQWGDKALVGLCGIDWSPAFNNKHWSNEKAKWVLDSLYIWELK